MFFFSFVCTLVRYIVVTCVFTVLGLRFYKLVVLLHEGNLIYAAYGFCVSQKYMNLYQHHSILSMGKVRLYYIYYFRSEVQSIMIIEYLIISAVWSNHILTPLWTTIVKVYIIGGDGTQKGANAIHEVSTHDDIGRCLDQDLIGNTRVA